MHLEKRVVVLDVADVGGGLLVARGFHRHDAHVGKKPLLHARRQCGWTVCIVGAGVEQGCAIACGALAAGQLREGAAKLQLGQLACAHSAREEGGGGVQRARKHI